MGAPGSCWVPFLSSGSQAKGHWLWLNLCTRSPTPEHFPPSSLPLSSVSGVIRGSCLNWEKGPHPAFTLPVGGGELTGGTLESWAAGNVSAFRARPLPGWAGQGSGDPAFLGLSVFSPGVYPVPFPHPHS